MTTPRYEAADPYAWPASMRRSLDAAMASPSEILARFADKRRVRLIVEADLDPVPGWGDNPEDWQALAQRLLDDTVGHYHPTVTIAPDVTQ